MFKCNDNHFRFHVLHYYTNFFSSIALAIEPYWALKIAGDIQSTDIPSRDNPISLPHFSTRLAHLSLSLSLFLALSLPSFSRFSRRREVGSVPIIQTEALIDGDCGRSREGAWSSHSREPGMAGWRGERTRQNGGRTGRDAEWGKEGEIPNTAIYSPRVAASLHPVPASTLDFAVRICGMSVAGNPSVRFFNCKKDPPGLGGGSGSPLRTNPLSGP